MKNTPACCFTGYRPDKFPFPTDGVNERYVEFENRLFDAVFSLPGNGCFRFYTGAAMGFDIIAAETVLLLKKRDPRVTLTVAVPFSGHTRGWDKEWQKRFERVKNLADEVVVVCDRYFTGCYQVRNRYMVDNSTVVLTYYDGQPSGTRNTLNYAAKKGLPVINLAEDGTHTYDYDVQLSFETEYDE